MSLVSPKSHDDSRCVCVTEPWPPMQQLIIGIWGALERWNTLSVASLCRDVLSEKVPAASASWGETQRGAYRHKLFNWLIMNTRRALSWYKAIYAFLMLLCQFSCMLLIASRTISFIFVNADGCFPWPSCTFFKPCLFFFQSWKHGSSQQSVSVHPIYRLCMLPRAPDTCVGPHWLDFQDPLPRRTITYSHFLLRATPEARAGTASIPYLLALHIKMSQTSKKTLKPDVYLMCRFPTRVCHGLNPTAGSTLKEQNHGTLNAFRMGRAHQALTPSPQPTTPNPAPPAKLLLRD